MFEAILHICTADAKPVCYDMLLPGYEAPSKAACSEKLTAAPPKQPDGDAAECRPLGPALSVTEIAPGVFVHQGQIAEPDAQNAGDVSNLGFVIGETSVATFDSGTSRAMGEALWRAIRANTDKPVKYAVLSHTHPDHVFGASVLQLAGAEVVGHNKLERALVDRGANYLESLSTLIGEGFAGTDLPQVTIPVADEMTLDLGGRELKLTAWATAHTNSDLTMLDVKTSTFFAGDLVFDQHVPVLDGSLRGWEQVLKEMALIHARHVVPGHGRINLEWPDATAPVQRYLGCLASDTKTAISKGERLGDAVTHIGHSEAVNWSLFDDFNPRNATTAFTELEWE